jgi:hypothetical protein
MAELAEKARRKEQAQVGRVNTYLASVLPCSNPVAT